MLNSLNNAQVVSSSFGNPGNPEFACPNSSSVTVTIFNSQVAIQMTIGPEGASTSLGNWTPSLGISLPPGVWSFSRDDFGGQFCHAMRFAQVDPNVIAIVSASSA